MQIPSKKQVQKAGKILAKNDKSETEYNQAMAILSQWRSLHGYPINTFQALLRQKTKVFKSPIIAQRLKRTPSIITKLQRFPNMDLSRMQDIGGLRVILATIDDVYRLHESLTHNRRKHEHEPLLPPNDYIKEPKADGYRSLHQVFKYHSKTNESLNGLQIELQIRTRLQHSWATAVETLGIIEKSSFKTGQGSDEFKTFFKLASALFSYHEKQPILTEYANMPVTEVVQALNDLQESLQIFAKLQGLIITAKQVETAQNKTDEYHLMELDITNSRVNLVAFSKSQFDLAESFYKMREIDTANNPNIELVLISAGNLKEIKKAYPNYFLDTQDFIKNLKSICEKYQ